MSCYCATLEGPIVSAAKKAIETVNIAYVLPWVSKEQEVKVRQAFDLTFHAREKGGDAQVLADKWFIETILRLHLHNDGIPFNGIEPTEESVASVMTTVERVVLHEDDTYLSEWLHGSLENTLKVHLAHIHKTRPHDPADTEAAREYAHAVHALYRFAEETYCAITAQNGISAPISMATVLQPRLLQRTTNKIMKSIKKFMHV